MDVEGSYPQNEYGFQEYVLELRSLVFLLPLILRTTYHYINLVSFLNSDLPVFRQLVRFRTPKPPYLPQFPNSYKNLSLNFLITYAYRPYWCSCPPVCRLSWLSIPSLSRITFSSGISIAHSTSALSGTFHVLSSFSGHIGAQWSALVSGELGKNLK